MIAIDFSMNSAGVVVGNSNNPAELQMLCFRQRKRDDSLVKNIIVKEYLECPKSDEERFYHIAKIYQKKGCQTFKTMIILNCS